VDTSISLEFQLMDLSIRNLSMLAIANKNKKTEITKIKVEEGGDLGSKIKDFLPPPQFGVIRKNSSIIQ
jgi:hypothetical protein